MWRKEKVVGDEAQPGNATVSEDMDFILVAMSSHCRA